MSDIFNDGVYINPNNGNIIASGVLSANGSFLPSPESSFYGDKSLPQVISTYSPPVDLSGYYQKSETSSNIQLNDKFNEYALKSYVDDQILSTLELIAPKYSSSKTYNVGDIVSQYGKLYKCTTAITEYEPWTLSNWIETTVVDMWNNANNTYYGGEN